MCPSACRATGLDRHPWILDDPYPEYDFALALSVMTTKSCRFPRRAGFNRPHAASTQLRINHFGTPCYVCEPTGRVLTASNLSRCEGTLCVVGDGRPSKRPVSFFGAEPNVRNRNCISCPHGASSSWKRDDLGNSSRSYSMHPNSRIIRITAALCR